LTVLVDGVEYRAHGVKGANGEWVLEALIGRAWHDIGLAEKKDKMWDAWQGNHESLHSTLNAAIAALIAHRLTQINN